MQVHQVSVGPDHVAFRQSSGAGRPVVLMHGNSCSSRSFDRQLASGLGAKYRLVALDLPGHGQSARAANPIVAYSLRGYAEVLLATVAQLGLQCAVFVGWSLGGHILLQAADQLDEASGFLIFGAPPLKRPLNPQSCFLPHAGSSELFSEELSDAQVRSFAEMFLRPNEATVSESFIDDIRKTDPRARSCLLAGLQRSEYMDEVEILQRLRAPMAILHGEEDQLVSHDYIRLLAIPSLWRGVPQVIANAGHAPHWEKAQAFNALVQDFIDYCDSRTCGAPG